MNALKKRKFFRSEYLEVMKLFAQVLDILQVTNNDAGFLIQIIDQKKKLKTKKDKVKFYKPLEESLCSGIDIIVPDTR